MAKQKPWYHTSKKYGPNKEIRIFFEELLKKCSNMKSGSGEIEPPLERYGNRRPFSNAFNASKPNMTVFTPKTCYNFLELVLRNESIHRAINTIHSWEEKISFKFSLEEEENIIEQINDCPYAKTRSDKNDRSQCIEFLIKNKHFRDTCETCPIKLIYEILPKIEKACHAKFASKKKLLKKYDNPNDKKIVTQIYKDIQNFENTFQPKDFNVDNIIKLFNSCIQCANICDVSGDYNLAYIKWYTARLCTWPYFKSYLLQLGKYSEFTIYNLLNSASAICSSMDITKNTLKFFCDVEMDKIISYISLAYQTPFLMRYYETPEQILENCSRIINANLERV